MKIFDKFSEKCTSFQTKGVTGLLDIGKYFDDPESKYKCDKCGKKFGFFIFTVRACSVAMGKSYIVKCRKCGHINIRIRGDLKV